MKKIDMKNKYVIFGACFVIIIFVAIIFMFSESYAFEGIGQYNLICDKDIAVGGSTINCTITGTVVSEKKVSSLETMIELSDNLEFVDFTTDEIWQGIGDDGFVALYTDENKEGTFNVGTFNVRLKDGVTNTTEFVKLKDNYFYDDNFDTHSIEKASIEIKTPQYSSNVYNLANEYIITNTKDITEIINNISVEGCNVSIYNDGSNVNSGTIVDGARLIISINDTVLDEFSVIYIDSDVYDLSKEYVISSVNELKDIINDIDTVNGSLSIKNKQLVLSYNSVGIITYDILNINSDLYKISLDDNYIFINGEINNDILNNISKTDNINLSINDGILNVIYDEENVKSLKILNVYSTKYDINLDEGFIYTKANNSSDIINNIQNNVNLSVSDNKLNIKYNNKTIMDLDIVSISSSNYKISYDKGYIYTSVDNTLDLIKKNINFINCDISISSGILTVKYNENVVDEFNLYYINSSMYKIVDNNIYIKGSVDYGTFINNIEFNGLDYVVYNISNEVVSSGNIDDNFKIKLIINTEELDIYTIKTEYLEINNLSIKEDSKIIYNIAIGTKVEDLLKNIDTSGTVEVYNKLGNKMSSSNILSSSSIVKIILSTETIEYTISVLGDTTSDGSISMVDVSKLYAHYRNKLTDDKKLNEAEILAVDVTGDGSISMMDVLKLYTDYRASRLNNN